MLLSFVLIRFLWWKRTDTCMQFQELFLQKSTTSQILLFLGVEISKWSPFMTSNLMQHYIFWVPNNYFIFQNTFQELFFWWSFGFDICWKTISNVDILCTHVCTISISWLHYLNLHSYFNVFKAYMHLLNFLLKIFCNVLFTQFVTRLREVQIERCKG
jgi:hypothetical protein